MDGLTRKNTGTSGSGTKLKKRIFLNLDGTGQSEYTLEGHKDKDGKLKSKPVSNIARIGRATLTDDEDLDFQQIVYYLAGVGASSEDSWLAKTYQGMSGLGLVQNVREAYGFLCNNYDYGDEIYITGFSRGAFTARSVAGMVGKVGILTKKGLELFYEAFDFYEDSDNKTKWGPKLQSPVSEEAGTTREYIPDPDRKKPDLERIKIKAVGVFDTVGALTGDWAFHDVKFGEHIENAFHALALDEKRRYFAPTLWESSSPKDYENFEQCWMVGDHSNIGGSWDDQQLADLSLAWMMSKYENLGAKFNEQYLYDEYIKYKTRCEKEKPFKPIAPRQWGEGRCEEVDMTYLRGWFTGPITRTPMMYQKFKKDKDWLGNLVPDGRLKNTNETVHPSVRYRRFCQNPGGLGPKDSGQYNPDALRGWAWPTISDKGRAGGYRILEGKEVVVREKEEMIMPESIMGKYEKILLAIYDQDLKIEGRNDSIWEQVMGGTLPEDHREYVAELVETKRQQVEEQRSRGKRVEEQKAKEQQRLREREQQVRE